MPRRLRIYATGSGLMEEGTTSSPSERKRPTSKTRPIVSPLQPRTRPARQHTRLIRRAKHLRSTRQYILTLRQRSRAENAANFGEFLHVPGTLHPSRLLGLHLRQSCVAHRKMGKPGTVYRVQNMLSSAIRWFQDARTSLSQTMGGSLLAGCPEQTLQGWFPTDK